MSTCRFDKAVEEYRTTDGEPCLTDEYGDPTRHCTARRTCSVHIGPDELTCPRCIGRTRADLSWIVNLSALMATAALSAGVDSEAANLAGPAADPEAWSWRKIAARQGRAWHLSLVEDDDEHHPYLVLGRWDLMLREDYEHPSDKAVTIANAASYLSRQLHRLANDPDQDYGQFAREIRKCRDHLEAVLATSRRVQRGAPCPECTTKDTGVGPRLVRRFGHWCNDEDCDRLHYDDDSGDIWVCPRDRDHWWSHEDYSRWIEERRRYVQRHGA